MHDQLAQRYLIPAGLQHGIYLIYWIAPGQRPRGGRRGPTNKQTLAGQMERQAEAAGDGLRIRPYILDISHP